jgi:hypothetical protein
MAASGRSERSKAMPHECEKHEVNWIALIEAEDVEALWMELYRLVSRQAMVSGRHLLMSISSQENIYSCLTQELFLELLARQRFDHYLNNAFSNADIEGEITCVIWVP